MFYKSMDWFLYDRDPLNPPPEDEGTILSGLGAIGLKFSPTTGGLSQMGGIKFFTLLGGTTGFTGPNSPYQRFIPPY